MNIWKQFSTNIYNEFPSRYTTNFGSTNTSFLHKTVLIDSIIDKLFDTLSIVILITFQSALQHLCQPSSQQPAPVPHSTCRKLYISVQFIVFRDRAHRAHQHQPWRISYNYTLVDSQQRFQPVLVVRTTKDFFPSQNSSKQILSSVLLSFDI